MKNFLFLAACALSMSISINGLGQCEIKNLVGVDGSMYYYVNPLIFYQTSTRELKGGVITDKENYFISLQPRPFPPKPAGMKLKGDLQVHLSNQKTYSLKNYDSRYTQADSVFELVYLIDKKMNDDLLQNEVESVTLQLAKNEAAQVYTFKRFKKAISEQLKCLEALR
jgi:hypothetical protein